MYLFLVLWLALSYPFRFWAGGVNAQLHTASRSFPSRWSSQESAIASPLTTTLGHCRLPDLCQ
ncbi:hypothetical protein E2C01_014225 [Portunus trituberculatus]|uniref:Uncharacterized protein n=1 Tax=Portunus trituberculatus TaxID=210409 RepID=A0A5B7DJ80_PORTR|nr:hypothetical protein [Portunus trituberculatus]